MASQTPNPGDYVVASSLISQPEIDNSLYVNRLNHTMLRVRHPDRSLAFYKDLLGMSQTFTFNTGPFTVYYLAYQSPGDTVPSDILVTSGARSGLLELIHMHGSESQNKPVIVSGDDEGHFGFGHLGFTVPDVLQTLKKAESSGWNVLKWPEDVSVKALGLPKRLHKVELHTKFVKLYTQIGFLEDPDG